MAHYQDRLNFPFRAASAIAQYVPVRLLGDPQVTPGSALNEAVVRAGSTNEDVLGQSQATVATPGGEIAVTWSGMTKGIAGASLGAGARLVVGSTNGILIPYVATGAVASGATRLYSIGRSVRNAAAGDIFTFLCDPENIT